MTAAPVPGDVRRFLLATIPTVPHLEALLLLRGNREEWTLTHLAARLYSDPAIVSAIVDDLVATQLVARDVQGCRYAPADEDSAAQVDAVAAWYARETVAVAELIHSTSDRKAQRFADAFRLRKES